MKILFAGDSWAAKAYTNDNYDKLPYEFDNDIRLADFWPVDYQLVTAVGQGNLHTLDKILAEKIDSNLPIVWVFTEPGRDYGRITGNPELEWLKREDYFEIRGQLTRDILSTIKQALPNPIALIGGLSDVDVDLAHELGFTVLHPSWQQWIADQVNSQWFTHGWGASDVGWRLHHDGITPSRSVTFAWDELIKEWCWWEEQGYFCHEHPSIMANQLFAESLKPKLMEWLSQ